MNWFGRLSCVTTAQKKAEWEVDSHRLSGEPQIRRSMANTGGPSFGVNIHQRGQVSNWFNPPGGRRADRAAQNQVGGEKRPRPLNHLPRGMWSQLTADYWFQFMPGLPQQQLQHQMEFRKLPHPRPHPLNHLPRGLWSQLTADYWFQFMPGLSQQQLQHQMEFRIQAQRDHFQKQQPSVDSYVFSLFRP